MTDTIDPVEPTMTAREWLLRELSTNPKWKEAPYSDDEVIGIGGAVKQETARERALKILSTNPKWKEIPPDDCIIGIGGGKPISRT
jgi:hypothetical protein